jgi:5-methylcytosine-specific restriction protein A
MPWNIPAFRPARLREQQSEAEASRPNANERGYCSKAWKAKRLQVLTRDGYQCQDCGRIVDQPRQAHVDHIVARGAGGTDELSNLRTLCASCHSSRTARDQHAGYRSSFGAREQQKIPRAL